MMARIGGVAALAVLVVATASAVAALQGTPSPTRVADGGGDPGPQEGYALTPRQNAILLAECMEDRGVEVVRNGTGITPAQDPNTSPVPGEASQRSRMDQQVFDETLRACEETLADSGYLLPGDDPAYLTTLYTQFAALARCYRSAGIAVSDPPDIADFIATRREGDHGWSPQQEAERLAGVAAAREAEKHCDVPSPPRN